MNKISKIILIILFFLFVSCSSRVKLPRLPSDNEYQILHINDFHSQYQSFKPSGLPCNFDQEKDGNCVGGMTRLIAKVDEIKGTNKNVLIFDAGDLSQGSLFSKILKEKPASWFANRLGYDAQTIGNHEFDEGIDYVINYLKALKNPYLVSNVEFRENCELKELIKRRLIINKGDQKIGILGLLTDEAYDIIQGANILELQSYQEALESNIRELRLHGVKLVVLLSHIGYEEDLKLASQVCGIDVIIGGHSHTLLSNMNSSAEGGYPTLITSSCGEPVAIVTASSRGKYLGKLSVAFDENGILTKAEGGLILIEDSYPQDKNAILELSSWLKAIKPFYEKIMGYSDIDLPVTEDICRFRECLIGDIIADAMLWSYRDKNPDFAVINAGAIRGGIGKGPVSLANVYETLPFKNTLSIFKLNGSVVKAMLEHGLSRAENSTKKNTGRFLQVSGLRIIWDVKKPVGERIKEVFVIKHNGEVPIDSGTYYTVVAPDFIRQGGDGFKIVRDKAIEIDDSGPTIENAFINYLDEIKRIQKTGKPRIISKQ